MVPKADMHTHRNKRDVHSTRVNPSAASQLMANLQLDEASVGKLRMITALTEARLVELVADALRNKNRRAILRSLIEYEMSATDPLSYTELRKRLGNPDSNKLSYHLRLLRRAGLVKRVTDFSPSELSAETGYRSFYKTTALLVHVLKPFQED